MDGSGKSSEAARSNHIDDHSGMVPYKTTGGHYRHRNGFHAPLDDLTISQYQARTVSICRTGKKPHPLVHTNR